MTIVSLNKDEVRYVGQFVESALAKYREDNTNLESLLYLINIWPLVCDADRGVIGKEILDLLNKQGVRAAILVREVLQYVGTPVCGCKASDAWQAVRTFLTKDHLLSVNGAALEAGFRLLRNDETEGSKKIISSCLGDVRCLSNSLSPEIRDFASQFCEFAAKLGK